MCEEKNWIEVKAETSEPHDRIVKLDKVDYDRLFPSGNDLHPKLVVYLDDCSKVGGSAWGPLCEYLPSHIWECDRPWVLGRRDKVLGYDLWHGPLAMLVAREVDEDCVGVKFKNKDICDCRRENLEIKPLGYRPWWRDHPVA